MRVTYPDTELSTDCLKHGLAQHDGHGSPEHDVAVVDQSSPNRADFNLDGHFLFLLFRSLRDDVWD
jgi:hypothetical protein